MKETHNFARLLQKHYDVLISVNGLSENFVQRLCIRFLDALRKLGVKWICHKLCCNILNGFYNFFQRMKEMLLSENNNL